MATTSHIYFLEETPGNWQDHVLKNGKLNTDHDLKEILKEDKSTDSGSDQKLDKFISAIKSKDDKSKDDKDSDDVIKIEMRKLQGMTIV